MKAWLALFTLLAASVAWGQDTIHITAVGDHIRTKDEPAFSAPLHTKRITGTIGNRKYTMEEAAMFAFHFEVGQDYAVLKLSDRSIKVETVDKKGRKSSESLTVLSIEEVETK